MTNQDFPWGELEPAGGFRIGDYVGLIYSDHEEYVFDNPTGVVIAVVSDEDEDIPDLVTVQVEGSIFADRVYLIEREGVPAAAVEQ